MLWRLPLFVTCDDVGMGVIRGINEKGKTCKTQNPLAFVPPHFLEQVLKGAGSTKVE